MVDGLLEVSTHYGGRLPELLAGIDRSRLGVPAIYPTSCMPQAWAAATPLLLLRALLRLDPQAPHSEIWAAPILRHDEEIHLQGVPFAGARLDIDAIGTDIEVRGIPAGISLHRRPRSPV